MLRRFLLVLLTLCLAAPALAMPLGMVPPAPVQASQAHPGHGSHGQDQTAPVAAHSQHECIGCIAPLVRLPALVAVAAPGRDTRLPGLESPLAARGEPPETPPPRS